jgi:hypothetical protein
MKKSGCLLVAALAFLLIGLALVGISMMMPHAQPVTAAHPEALRRNIVLPADPSNPNSAQPLQNTSLAEYAAALRSPFTNDLNALADAPRYNLRLRLDARARKLFGEQTVHYTNRSAQPLPDMVLRLYPNTAYMGGDMVLGAIAVDGVAARFEFDTPIDRSIVRVQLPQLLPAGRTTVLSLSFTISILRPNRIANGVFGLDDGFWALPNAYAVVAPREGDVWRIDAAPTYGDIVLSEMALYRVQISAPANLRVVATGVCQSHSAQPETAPPAPTATTTCVAGPVRDFAMHFSSGYVTVSISVPSHSEPVLLTSYFLPQHRRTGERALQIAADALAAYEKRFGAYPYKELKVFATTATAGGIEYPMLAGVMHKFYANDDDYFEWLVAHEVAHQWWYGMVGSNPITDAWLDEALTQYTTSLYWEERYGKASAERTRNNNFVERYLAERKANGDRRVAQVVAAFPRKSYFPVVYGKGPLFFDAVRRASDDATFTTWLRTYFDRMRYRIARPNDLLQAANDVGIGHITQPAYQQWILGN